MRERRESPSLVSSSRMAAATCELASISLRCMKVRVLYRAEYIGVGLAYGGNDTRDSHASYYTLCLAYARGARIKRAYQTAMTPNVQSAIVAIVSKT
jgi:hypothetical protein